MKSGVISSRLRDMNNKLTFQHDCIGNIKDNQILTVHCEMTYSNFAKKKQYKFYNSNTQTYRQGIKIDKHYIVLCHKKHTIICKNIKVIKHVQQC